MKTQVLKYLAAAMLALGVSGAMAAAQAQPYDSNDYNDRYERPSYRYDNDYRDNRDDRYREPSYRDRYNDRYDRPRYYKPYAKKRSDGCLATIRATGVGNVFPGIARLNATLAWRREVQSVYGFRASWVSAKNKSMECYGTRCTAKGRPCRY